MQRLLITSSFHWLLYAAWILCAPALALGADDSISLLRPVLEKHCIKCHGAKPKPAGEKNLALIRDESSLRLDLELIRSLIDVLDTEAMPPETEPPLPTETRTKLLVELNAMLGEEVRRNKTFGQAPIRRMNRFQYNNAVQDLFDLKVDVFALPERMLREHGNYFQPASGKMPPQLRAGSRPLGKSQLVGKRLAGVAPFPQDLRAEHGFDNRGDHLSLSPLLLESFFKLSRSIMESPDFGPQTCGIWPTFFAAPAIVDSSAAQVDSNQVDSKQFDNKQVDSKTAETLRTVVRERLREFLQRAFRRPVDPALIDRYADMVTRRLRKGDAFAHAMGMAASAAITSPRFLYIYDRSTEGLSGQVDDYDLASRLSFFLWGSIPDRQLLDLAAEGKLHERSELEQQFNRMINDHKVKRFCDSFPAQWLQLERIIASVPDPKLFPEFYFGKYRVSMHMMMEPLLVFETLLVEDRPIMQLVDSDFSYRSDLLESWYRTGKKSKRVPPTAVPFRRVRIDDRRQGGVITTAAAMTMTSGPRRTKPITRGAWLATVVFNDPPEPPPADVPPLPETDRDTSKLTLRERLALHREQASCAGCHTKIDPLGFAFENFGPTGVWREKYANGRRVDASGVLFRKHEFDDVVGFKNAILNEKDRFARGFAEHLLAFALGRNIDAADSPALDQMVREAGKSDYRMRAMIKSVVLSDPFSYKSTPQSMSKSKSPSTPPSKSPSKSQSKSQSNTPSKSSFDSSATPSPAADGERRFGALP